MTTRIEKRSLRNRVSALRSNVWRLARVTNFGGEDLRKSTDISRFHMYLRQTKALANLTHRLNPNDIVWRERKSDDAYVGARNVQEHIQKVEEYLDRSFGGRRKKMFRVIGHAVTELHHTLDLILGSASRTKVEGIQELAGRVIYDRNAKGRAQSREVLADLLEERGYEGEANALRAATTWTATKKVLTSLGIRTPSFKPYALRSARSK